MHLGTSAQDHGRAPRGPGGGPPAARAVAVWLAVTAVCAAAVLLAGRPVLGPTDPDGASFPELLVRLCTVVLLLALAWLWIVTTVTVGQVLGGRVPSARGVTRRWVLLACGVALAAGAAPAAAAEGDDVLAGLRLPERAVSSAPPASPAPAPAPARADARPVQPAQVPGVHVVRAGESLWSIAASSAPEGSDLDARWRAIWAANRDVVGDDPDLILPGQRLRLPPTGTASPSRTTHDSGDTSHETGDRP